MNHTSKFQLAGVRRFRGVREQINKQTYKQSNKQTDSLTDWCFDREICLTHIMLLMGAYSDPSQWKVQ